MPAIRTAERVAPILRAVDQARDVAVVCAAVRALLRHADEIARDVARALGVPGSVVGRPETRVEQQPRGPRRRPRRLRYAHRVQKTDTDGLRRDAHRIGDALRESGTFPADALLVPEHGKLVAG